PTPGCSATTPKTSRPTTRAGVLRRFGPISVLPLSLVAIATGLVAIAAVLTVMLAVHNPDPAAQPTVVPPSDAQPNPAAPKSPAPTLDIVDTAFIDVLKQDGVPVPSPEYVRIHGHAVCDFLAHQPDFAEAVNFVQRTSIWDGNQSTEFVAGAIFSYCPQYKSASLDEMQQASQNAVPGLQGIQDNLQSVQDDLQGIQDDLQGIHDELPAIPGQH
ncbi:MAG: DUF732 domain-containing protein, partial [Ilumatobacteraceae bacterium]